MKGLRRSLVGLLSVFLVAGCGSAPASQNQGGAPESRTQAAKRLVVSTAGEMAVMQYQVGLATSTVAINGSREAANLVNGGLTHEDNEDLRLPLYAETVPSVENGLWQLMPDGRMETTWRLKPGARWHDGQPFTADDLLFTLRIGQDDDVPAFSDVAYESVESAHARDSQTLTVLWKRPFIYADGLLSDPVLPLPKHLLEKAYLEDKAGFLELPYWSTEYVGTGPFVVREFVLGSHIVLVANDNYILGRPKIDEIEIRFIADPTTLIANMLAGSVDVTLNARHSLEQALQARDQWPNGHLEIEFTGWIVYFPQFLNPSPSAISDVRFRRAMVHALDRQEMADSLQGGIVPVAHAHLSPSHANYRDVESSIVRYDYDPRRAAQLLEATGYTRGGDGSMRDSSGNKLEVEIRVTAGRDLTTKTNLAIADYWQRLGISAQAVIVPAQRARDPEYRATFPGFYMANQPNTLSINDLARYQSTKNSLPENSYRVTGNHNRYANPQFDALIEQFFVTVPKVERMQTLGKILNMQTDQVLNTGLFYNAIPYMVNNRVRGVKATNESWNAHAWDIS